MGGEALVPPVPVIDALWPGFVDLRRTPELAWSLPESAEFPALAEALVKLNAVASPVWTSKCDLWPHLTSDEYDADELDAPPGCSAHAMGCYIDLLPKGKGQWASPQMASADCKRVCGLLRPVPLRCCRVDLVIRRAIVTPDRLDLGITAYLTGCGSTAADAVSALQAALGAFADALIGHSTLE